MDSMMGALTSPSPLVLSLWLIHWIGGTLWILGAVLFAVWAVKHLSPEHLRSLGLWTFVIGILISIITASAAAQGMQWLLGGGHGPMASDSSSTQSMMQEMLRLQSDSSTSEHQEHEQLLRSQRPPSLNAPNP